MDAARAAYDKALALEPAYAQAWSNLGEWLMTRGLLEDALTHFDSALRHDPQLLEAMNNRIAVLYELGRFSDAESAARSAIAIHPSSAALHVNLGNVLLHSGKFAAALEAFRVALQLNPASPEAHLNLATLLGETEHLEETLEFIRHEIDVKGENAQRLAALALAQQKSGDYVGAEQTCEKVLARQPNNISALVTLAGCLGYRSDHRGAIRQFERALTINPRMPSIYSNIAFDATYLPDLPQEEVFAYHRKWSERFEHSASVERFEHSLGDDPERRLRIGYVSGDFGMHPVGFLIREVIRHRDPARFEVFCYSMTRRVDGVTDEIRASADHWVDGVLMNDAELCNQIRDDGIDILVDLSGHTAHNRLPVFVRRPAPVQATWIGYFHSTGLECIDYYLTDPFTTPADTTQLFSETPVWLPHTRFCYSPPSYCPEVAPAPVMANGHVTFGCFNRVEKLVDPVIDAWAEILRQVPDAILLLKSRVLDNDDHRTLYRNRFAERGIDPKRIECRGISSHADMLGEYGDVDIALDPFPFNGGMTTLEALWMGVPLIALAGQGIVARQSASALRNVGLPELIFADAQSYIRGAVELARDRERLTALRSSLRERMSASPLCQAERFTRDLERLYRRMWHARCHNEKLPGLDGHYVAKAIAARRTVLHVGCGPTDKMAMPPMFHHGWDEIRIDLDPAAKPNIVASMVDLGMIADGTADAVFSSHSIEHLFPHEVPVALREFRRVLKPDGMLLLTCPDLMPVCEAVLKDGLEDPMYMSAAGPISAIDVLYGFRADIARGKTYMAHKTGFTLSSMRSALTAAGFGSVTVERRQQFDIWVLAYPDVQSPERMEMDVRACFPD